MASYVVKNIPGRPLAIIAARHYGEACMEACRRWPYQWFKDWLRIEKL